ncbi:hypothetical protein AUJ14_03120 [Candidatus Micrarchaeota archaeon CG1_02_55_22]|nr:MAG: hypothetical protein AUJ14_03120 [Candidatus Micrarchaeota archaeon CG1_02_55_22]
MSNYFFDSYAIVEMMKANPAYERFRKERVYTTIANLAEVYYYSLRAAQVSSYRAMVMRLKPEFLQPSLADWEAAAQFKYENRDKRLSYVDCLGHSLAGKHGLTFLTGDAAFKGMRNVEHVK